MSETTSEDLDGLREQVRQEVLEATVAHIVTPASKMHDLLMGEKSKVKAVCGAWVKKAPDSDVNVCRVCFDAYLKSEPAEAAANTV